ncbi:MAG: diguanylate cyclase [Mariprofundaceae bacterium]
MDLFKELEITPILQSVTKSAIRITEARSGTSGLIVNAQISFAGYQMDAQWHESRFNLESTHAVSRHMMKHGTPYIVEQMEGKFHPTLEHKFGIIDNLIALPLFSTDGMLVACITLFNTTSTPNLETMELLDQLAQSTSVAIEHAVQLARYRKLEADVDRSVAAYRTLVEQIPAVTYITSPDRGKMLFVSPQVESMLGISVDDYMNNANAWYHIIHEEDQERVKEAVRYCAESGDPYHAEYRIIHKDGGIRWFSDQATCVQEDHETIYLQGVISDITERKRVEEKLVSLAHYDQLTSLANRTLFHDRLEQAEARADRQRGCFALLYLDLDGFKAVNDELGHKAGDGVLKEASIRLLESVRHVDTVARMGGDEFTIILSDTGGNADDVAHIAQKIVTAIAKPYAATGERARISASIGIAIYPLDSQTTEELIVAADAAMYRAKQCGKNNFQFSVRGGVS